MEIFKDLRAHIFLLLLIVDLYKLTVEACSCSFDHPQTHVCNADFVIIARVNREIHKHRQIIYKVQKRKVFKMSDKARVALRMGRLFTASDGAMCGVRLNVNETYLITGSVVELKPRIYLCNFIKPLTQVTKRQRKGLRMLYRKGCKCEIVTCPWYHTCPENVDTCAWDMTNSCIADHGICLPTTSGKCGWTKNQAQKQCETQMIKT